MLYWNVIVSDSLGSCEYTAVKLYKLTFPSSCVVRPSSLTYEPSAYQFIMPGTLNDPRMCRSTGAFCRSTVVLAPSAVAFCMGKMKPSLK
jgi:hypothetical protein